MRGDSQSVFCKTGGMVHRSDLEEKARVWVVGLAVAVAGYFTFFKGYQYPPFLFWDENYHIASAQKYLHGVFFLEPHPPLGKLLIAAGEALLKANPRSDQFLDVMYIERDTLPAGFSFAGYRFFPALLGWLAAPLLFAAFYLAIGCPFAAAGFSLLYVFDNALVVHSRGAMLDSAQIFFSAACLVFYFLTWRRAGGGGRVWRLALGWGAVFGAATAIKLNSLILVLLFAPVLLRLQLKRSAETAAAAAFAAALVWCGSWGVHFGLARQVHPSLDDGGYFYTSPGVREVLDRRRQMALSDFAPMLHDAIAFTMRYEKGVPALNLCKEDENGSPSFFWPLGGRAINYRWEKADGGRVRYLYLQVNPIVWWFALAATCMSGALLIAAIFFPQGVRLKAPLHLAVFLGMYVGYMFVMARLDRVMYLYHYFLPLVFGLMLGGLFFCEVERCGPWRLSSDVKLGALGALLAAAIGCFIHFSPLTYYRPLDNDAVQRRAWAPIWDLRCVGCPHTSAIYQPSTGPRPLKRFKAKVLRISGHSPVEAFQEWGEPRYGVSVEDRPVIIGGRLFDDVLGVHAKSRVVYRLAGAYRRFSALAGLPDYLNGRGSVVFKVLGDGDTLWSSGKIQSGDPPAAVDVSVEGVDRLELRVLSSGDGINFDHGCWLNPRLQK